MNVKKIVVSFLLIFIGFGSQQETQAIFKELIAGAKGTLNEAKQQAVTLKNQAKTKVDETKQKAENLKNQAQEKATEMKNQAKTKVDETKQKAVDLKNQAQGEVNGVKKEIGLENANDGDESENTSEDQAVPENADNQEEDESQGEQTVVDEPAYSEEVIKKIDDLIPSVESLEQDKYLKIEDQQFSEEEMKYFVERLKGLASQQITKLSLILNRCNLSENDIDAILTTLDAFNQLLSVLCLTGNNIGDEGVRYIAAHLKELIMLNGLILSNTGLTGAGAAELLSQLAILARNRNGTNIQVIDLSNNDITDDFLKLIIQKAEEIRKYQEVVILLHDNPITNPENLVVPSYIRLKLNS